MSFGLLLLVSVAAGWVGSLSGMGGGVLLIPVMTFFGIDIKEAIAMSNLSTVIVSCSAASSYVRRHMSNIRVGAFLEVFAIAGALGGALLVLAAQRRMLFIICGFLFIGFGFLLWLKRDIQGQPAQKWDRFSRWLGWEGSYYDDAEGRTISYRGRRSAVAGPLMGLAGLTTGFLGIGGSALSVLINEWVMGLPPKVSLTTSSLLIGVMALGGSNVYLEAGLINPKWVAPAILGVPLGALLGSKMLIHLPGRVAQTIFLVILIVLGMEMVFHGIGGLP